MKKILVFLLIALMAFSFIACDDDDDSGDDWVLMTQDEAYAISNKAFLVAGNIEDLYFDTFNGHYGDGEITVTLEQVVDDYAMEEFITSFLEYKETITDPEETYIDGCDVTCDGTIYYEELTDADEGSINLHVAGTATDNHGNPYPIDFTVAGSFASEQIDTVMTTIVTNVKVDNVLVLPEAKSIMNNETHVMRMECGNRYYEAKMIIPD